MKQQRRGLGGLGGGRDDYEIEVGVMQCQVGDGFADLSCEGPKMVKRRGSGIGRKFNGERKGGDVLPWKKSRAREKNPNQAEERPTRDEDKLVVEEVACVTREENSVVHTN